VRFRECLRKTSREESDPGSAAWPPVPPPCEAPRVCKNTHVVVSNICWNDRQRQGESVHNKPRSPECGDSLKAGYNRKEWEDVWKRGGGVGWGAGGGGGPSLAEHTEDEKNIPDGTSIIRVHDKALKEALPD